MVETSGPHLKRKLNETLAAANYSWLQVQFKKLRATPFSPSVQMPHIKSAMIIHIICFRLDRVGPVSVFCLLEFFALLSSLLVLHNPCSYMCPPDDP